MGNAAFLLGFGAIIIWLYSSGKLGNIIGVIKNNPNAPTPGLNTTGYNNRSGPLVGGQGLLFG